MKNPLPSKEMHEANMERHRRGKEFNHVAPELFDTSGGRKKWIFGQREDYIKYYEGRE